MTGVMELTVEDVAFLAALGDEMRTQDTVGQAEPRFWVVQHKVKETCWEGETDVYDVVCDGEVVGESNTHFDKGDVYTVPVHYVERNVPDTLFMTLRECEEYIKANRHNLGCDPHPYAMTAFRSPQVERLWKLLQEVDWSGFMKAAARRGLM